MYVASRQASAYGTTEMCLKIGYSATPDKFLVALDFFVVLPEAVRMLGVFGPPEC